MTLDTDTLLLRFLRHIEETHREQKCFSCGNRASLYIGNPFCIPCAQRLVCSDDVRVEHIAWDYEAASDELCLLCQARRAAKGPDRVYNIGPPYLLRPGWVHRDCLLKVLDIEDLEVMAALL